MSAAGFIRHAAALLALCVVARAGALADAASPSAGKLKKGVVVTAEEIAGHLEYGASGQLEPVGIPPEKLVFEIGSVTKVFTSLLFAQAIVEGKVKLETTVGELLGPGQKFEDERVGRITLRQLSTHTSGLARLPSNLAQGGNPNDPYAHYDRARLLAGVATAKLAGPEPFRLSYSNFGAGLLGDLLAKVYGKSWAELVREKITAPLGMADTAVELSAEQRKRLAPPYTGDAASHAWSLQALVGAGGLHSTAADLAVFGRALLAPEQSPFAPALRLLLAPQTDDGQIGLGIMISKFKGEKVYEHNGGTGGYRSEFQVIPASRTVRIILANNSEADPGAIIARLTHEQPRQADSSVQLTPEALSAFEGTYDMGGGAKFTLVRRGSELWSRLTGQPFFRIYPHEQADRFFYKTVAAELQFHRQGDDIQSLTLFQNGREAVAPRLTKEAPKILFPTPEELATYRGTYRLAAGVEFELTIQNDTLYAQLTGQPPAPVFAIKPDYFVYDIVLAALEFERDGAGKVTALKLLQNGLIQRAEKIK